MADWTWLISIGLAVLILPQSGYSQGITECAFDKVTLCSCKSNKGVVDLQPLSRVNPYKMVAPQFNQVYYWLPCRDFTIDRVTAGVIQKVGIGTYNLGNHAEGYSDATPDGHARFRLTSFDFRRTSYITCICQQDIEGSITFDREDPVLNYLFTLTSKHCCPRQQTNGTRAIRSPITTTTITTTTTMTTITRTTTLAPPSNDLSIGSILIIVLATVLILALVVGVLGLLLSAKPRPFYYAQIQ